MAMNLKELAAELHLSQTTVSRALNGYPEVSEKTRQIVLAAAQRFGYRPSPAARRLATGRAHALGVVFNAERNALMDPLFVEYLAGVAETSAKQGFDILISPSTPHDEIATYSRLASDGTVDVVILSAPLCVDPRIALLSELKFPFVVHGRPPIPAGISYLDIDNFGAFQQATSFLIQLGHRRVMLINGEEQFTFVEDRSRGAATAFAAAGLPATLLDEHFMPMTAENAYRIARPALEADARPTAILCGSILVALGVLRAAAELGLDVPRDLSIVAHDDEMPAFPADQFHPQLTTTRSSIRAAGTRIAEVALARVAGQKPGAVAEVWPVQLIVRGSTAAAPERS
ncbi:substrate-binding domain-containing protein [Pleomorphomonas koreensis]|uniref:substrate-binding domain-containing protein n=1 Tax=Pleomorphomonas koreensis TaxID=257440 RepID=UPI00047BBBAB